MMDLIELGTSGAVLIPPGWKGQQVELEYISGYLPDKHGHCSGAGLSIGRRTCELVDALDGGLVVRSKTDLRLYPWTSIACVKLLEREAGDEWDGG